MKTPQSKVLSSLALTFTLVSIGLSSAHAASDAVLKGSIDATRGAVQVLQDTLAQSSARVSGVNATDYKKWNDEFRRKLDTAMLNYESRLETEIAEALRPQVEQYQRILMSNGFSPQQSFALRSSQYAALKQKAGQLQETYDRIYLNMLKSLFGWLPTVQYRLETFECRDRSGFFDVSRRLQATMSYDLTSIDGKTVIGNYEGPSKGCDPRYSENVTTAQAYIQSEQREFKNRENYYQQRNMDLPIFFTGLLLPHLKSVCSTQVCLPLVESDLKTALVAIESQIHKPFHVVLPDGTHFEIDSASNRSVSWVTQDHGVMDQPAVDASLPFDN